MIPFNYVNSSFVFFQSRIHLFIIRTFRCCSRYSKSSFINGKRQFWIRRMLEKGRQDLQSKNIRDKKSNKKSWYGLLKFCILPKLINLFVVNLLKDDKIKINIKSFWYLGKIQIALKTFKWPFSFMINDSIQ